MPKCEYSWIACQREATTERFGLLLCDEHARGTSTRTRPPAGASNSTSTGSSTVPAHLRLEDVQRIVTDFNMANSVVEPGSISFNQIDSGSIQIDSGSITWETSAVLAARLNEYRYTGLNPVEWRWAPNPDCYPEGSVLEVESSEFIWVKRDGDWRHQHSSFTPGQIPVRIRRDGDNWRELHYVPIDVNANCEINVRPLLETAMRLGLEGCTLTGINWISESQQLELAVTRAVRKDVDDLKSQIGHKDRALSALSDQLADVRKTVEDLQVENRQLQSLLYDARIME